jgi:hypothetical protein
MAAGAMHATRIMKDPRCGTHTIRGFLPKPGGKNGYNIIAAPRLRSKEDASCALIIAADLVAMGKKKGEQSNNTKIVGKDGRKRSAGRPKAGIQSRVAFINK